MLPTVCHLDDFTEGLSALRWAGIVGRLQVGRRRARQQQGQVLQDGHAGLVVLRVFLVHQQLCAGGVDEGERACKHAGVQGGMAFCLAGVNETALFVVRKFAVATERSGMVDLDNGVGG